MPASGRDFEAGQKWAAPDVNALQRLMRHIVENPEEAGARGRQARADMLEFFSPQVVSGLLVARLNQLVQAKRFPRLDQQ